MLLYKILENSSLFAEASVGLGITVNIKKLRADVEAPSYETAGASGMDVRACIDKAVRIPAGASAAIPTGLAFEIPSGYEMQVRPRSGLALKHGITLLNSPGTIDADYRGELTIILANLGDKDFTVHHGDRIAQLVFAPVVRASLTEVTLLSETDRGAGGFGSTGI
ncbi:MAG: dUTP diphosphatase [Spirochaetaceae bacterium]|nr:dUTP diphosphatase [Spirochaetaceae bacterium]